MLSLSGEKSRVIDSILKEAHFEKKAVIKIEKVSQNEKYIRKQFSTHGGKFNVGDKVRIKSNGKEDVIIDKRNIGWSYAVVMYLLKSIKGEYTPGATPYYFAEHELERLTFDADKLFKKLEILKESVKESTNKYPVESNGKIKGIKQKEVNWRELKKGDKIIFYEYEQEDGKEVEYGRIVTLLEDPKQVKFSKEFRAKISGSPKQEYTSFGKSYSPLVNKVIR